MNRAMTPLAILLGGFALAALLIATGPRVEQRAPDRAAPLVRVVEARPQTVQLHVRAHGTVVPRTESELVPEASGRVLEISPSLVSGGFFQQDEVLLRIDPLDYEVALEQARAGLARATSDLADARKDHDRQSDLSKLQATSDAQRDDRSERQVDRDRGRERQSEADGWDQEEARSDRADDRSDGIPRINARAGGRGVGLVVGQDAHRKRECGADAERGRQQNGTRSERVDQEPEVAPVEHPYQIRQVVDCHVGGE